MNLRRAALTCVCTLTLPLLGAVSAQADPPSGPVFRTVSYARYANASDSVTAVVSDPGSPITQAEVYYGPADAPTPLVAEASITAAADGSYDLTANLNLSSFAAGQQIPMEVQAKNSSSGSYTTAVYDGAIIIDRQAPTVALGMASGGSQLGTAVTATFTATDDNPGVSTTCQLDASVTQSCSSPVTYNDLAAGTHDIAIVATDAAGNVGTTAHYRETIVPQASSMSAFLHGSRLETGTSNELTVFVAGQGSLPTGTVSVSENGQVLSSAPAIFTGIAPVGDAAAFLSVLAGAPGEHTLRVTYSGDSHMGPSTSTVSYSSAPLGAAAVTRTRVVKTGLKVTLSCPVVDYVCAGNIFLGKSKARYSVTPGGTQFPVLGLDKKTLAALKAHKKPVVTLTLSDITRRTVKIKI